MIDSISPEQIESNKNRFISLLKLVGRKNTDKFIQWLENTDFFIAPASTKGHLCKKGGLCQHSLNVLDNASMLDKHFDFKLSQSGIVISSLLHDLCKINFYKTRIVWDKRYKQENNQWRTTEEWFIEDSFPLGHGEKSAILALRYLDLQDDEIVAIRWHIGAFEQGIHFNYPTGFAFKAAVAKYPLVKLIMIADQLAEFQETLNNGKTS